MQKNLSSLSGTRQLSEEQVKNTLELAEIAKQQVQPRKNSLVGKSAGYNTIARRVKVVETRERITVNPEMYDVETLKRKEF